MTKGYIPQEAIVNMYVLNRKATKYTMQILTNRRADIDNYPLIVGEFNHPFTSVGRSSRQKIIRKHCS